MRTAEMFGALEFLAAHVLYQWPFDQLGKAVDFDNEEKMAKSRFTNYRHDDCIVCIPAGMKGYTCVYDRLYVDFPPHVYPQSAP